MAKPLIIDTDAKHLIGCMIRYAEANRIDIETIKKIVKGKLQPAGDDFNRCCVLKCGFRCAFSIEEHPSGWMRHLSVSVGGMGGDRVPNEHAMNLLMDEFGFKYEYNQVPQYIEEGDYVAINVLEPV